MKKTSTYSLYTLYGLSCLIFFLYFSFPKGLVKNYLDMQLKNRFKPLGIILSELHLAIPPGVSFTNSIIEYKKHPLLMLDKIRILPDWLLFFQLKPALKVEAYGYSGMIDAHVSQTADKKQKKIVIDAEIENIQLKDLPLLKENLTDYEIEGNVNGGISVTTTNGFDAVGTAQINLSKAQLVLLNPMFDIENIKFSKISGDLKIDRLRIEIVKVDVKSEAFDGTLNGFIYIKNPINLSRIQISGVIQPDTVFLSKIKNNFPTDIFLKGKNMKKGIPFQITGTFKKPDFKLE